MKKIVAILIVMLMLASLAGCNIRKKIGEKIGEGIMEGMLGNGSGADVDIDGDTLTIEGENGEQMTIGGTEWPTSDMAKRLPKPKSGKVTYVLESDSGLYISMEGIDEDDMSALKEEVKKDYTVDAYDMTYEGGFSYAGADAEGWIVSIMYSDGALSLSITPPTE